MALAAQHIGSDSFAGVSVVYGRRIETPVASDERAARADQLQYELGEGPCLDAIWEHDTFQIDDLRSDVRYPRWSRQVHRETGISSSLSFQLFTAKDTVGALNVYSTPPRGFDERDRAEGVVFAAQVAVALRSAQIEEQLRSALETRSVIGQAQGILMERYGVDSQRAFEVLRRVSQNGNVRLSEVARRLVEDRSTPGS